VVFLSPGTIDRICGCQSHSSLSLTPCSAIAASNRPLKALCYMKALRSSPRFRQTSARPPRAVPRPRV
jgi:hypothetical protein